MPKKAKLPEDVLTSIEKRSKTPREKKMLTEVAQMSYASGVADTILFIENKLKEKP